MEQPSVNFSWLARADWVLLLFINFPIPLLNLVRSGLTYDAIQQFVFEFGLSIFLVIVLAVVTDHCRGYFAPVSRRLDENMFNSLQASLNEQMLHPPGLTLRRLEFVPNDFSIGAHVRGVLRPRVVISAGMLVGLVSKNPYANAILSHEIGHIRHFDRFLPGLIGLVVLEIFGHFFKASSEATYDISLDGHSADMVFPLVVVLYKILVLGGLLAIFSRYREFYADAQALLLTNFPGKYVEMLQSAAFGKDTHASLFHPSVRRRAQEALCGYRVLRKMRAWRCYLFIAALASLFQYLALDEGFVVQYALGTFIMFSGALVFEIFRRMLIRPGLATRSLKSTTFSRAETWANTSERRTSWNAFPVIFLLLGFLCALYVADAIAPGSQTVKGLAGGLVYAIYRSMRSAKR
jgi:hypothetical protein